MRGRTTFVIAHRLSTIRRADQILVIENGTICERGTHSELLAAQGRYYDLYTRQHAIETNLFLAPGEGEFQEEEAAVGTGSGVAAKLFEGSSRAKLSSRVTRQAEGAESE